MIFFYFLLKMDNPVIQQIMYNQGYIPGKGLGKLNNGILEPITTQTFVGSTYGGERSPKRIGLGIPSINGWNGKNYKSCLFILNHLSKKPNKFIKSIDCFKFDIKATPFVM